MTDWLQAHGLSPELQTKLLISVVSIAALWAAHRIVLGVAYRRVTDHPQVLFDESVKRLSIDADTARPRLGNLTGGLSGPAIKPVALRMVYQVAHGVKIPVVGIGGIRTAEDALEFLIAGARAIEIGTANFLDPSTAIKIIDGLDAFCRRRSIQKLGSIVGSLKV